MKIRIIATTICTILLTSALLFLFGCGSQKAPDSTNASDKNSDDAGNAARAVNLMSGVTAHAVSTKQAVQILTEQRPSWIFPCSCFKRAWKPMETR